MLFSWLEYVLASSTIGYIILGLLLLYSIKALYNLALRSEFVSQTVTSVGFAACYSIIDTWRYGEWLVWFQIIWDINIFYRWNWLFLCKSWLRKSSFFSSRICYKWLSRFCIILPLNPSFDLFILLFLIWIDTFLLRGRQLGNFLINWFFRRLIQFLLRLI